MTSRSRHRRGLRWLPLAVVGLLAACSQPPSTPSAAADGARMFGTIPFKACALAGTGGAPSVNAYCGRFEVPEDHAKPDGRRITLNIAWLPTDDGAAEPDPVFFLAGGPGQAATQLALPVSAGLREVRRQRDVLLVDQRGTGESNPLTCKDDTPGQDASLTPDAALVEALARSCAAAVADRADTRFYTTTDAIQDLDAVRAALGAERINLVGGSYGTRVAQQYAARYPEHTRTVVIDGVAPNDLVVGGEFARTFEASLQLQSARCDKVPACRERFAKNMRAQLGDVLARLRTTPAEVEYRDPGTGETRTGTVTADTLTGLAFMFSYMPETASLLPLVIDEADHGRYAPLMSLAQLMNRQFTGEMARGMQMSVVCAEDADRYTDDGSAAGTILGPDVAKMFFAGCPVWPHGTRPEAFTRPLSTDVPVLLLSGELDPVTPPEFAERVVKTLPNGRHLVVTGRAHGTMQLGCMPKLIGRFIETADAKALDASCLDAMSYVPPFTSFNGWEP